MPTLSSIKKISLCHLDKKRASICALCLNDCTREQKKLLTLVPEQTRTRVFRFVKEADRMRTLSGELLARAMICIRWDLKNSEIDFVKNDYGKPVMAGNGSCHFNISHSGDWVVCAVDSHELGIDVECVENRSVDIAEKFFTDSEHKFIINSEESVQFHRFTRIWTIKESYIKARGKGLSIGLDSFEVTLAEDQIRVKEMGELVPYQFAQYRLHSDCYCTLCAWPGAVPDNVQMCAIDDVIGVLERSELEMGE